MTWTTRRWLLAVGVGLLLAASWVEAQPYSSQIQSALRTFLITPHTWTGGGTVTTSTPPIAITQTWNNAAANFEILRITATPTATLGADNILHYLDTVSLEEVYLAKDATNQATWWIHPGAGAEAGIRFGGSGLVALTNNDTYTSLRGSNLTVGCSSISGCLPATSGSIRVPHGVAVMSGRNNANGANHSLVQWGAATDTLLVGAVGAATQIGGLTLSLVGPSTAALQLRTVQTTAPTCTGSCGTAPSVLGTDTAMTVTMGGTGVPASPFTVTFNGTWAAAPACVASLDTAGVAKYVTATVTSTTTVAVNTAINPGTSDKFHIICVGEQ